MGIPRIIKNWRKKKEMISFYKRYINKDDLCFDIGANIGERTDCFLQLGAKVITIEPQSSCLKKLKKKYQNNNMVQIEGSAVGDFNGEATLKICDEYDECSSLSDEFISVVHEAIDLHWSKTEKVIMKTMHSLCELYGKPKFCKVDVEGFESRVFLGMKEPLKYICFEFNKPLINDSKKSLEVLRKKGNYRCNYIQYEKMKLMLNEWISIESFIKNFDQIISPDILTGEIIVELIK